MDKITGVGFKLLGKIFWTLSKDRTIKLWNMDGLIINTFPALGNSNLVSIKSKKPIANSAGLWHPCSPQTRG